MTDRDALREQIEDTQAAFHRLLADVSDEALDAPSGNPAWTIGEVLYHMSVAPALMVADVSLITEERRLAQAMLRHFPQGIFDWVNKVATRHRGQDLERADLARQYDAATTRILATLDGVRDEDFGKSARYPEWDPLLSGDVTLVQLFKYVKAHFESHEPEIREAVASFADQG